VITESVKQGIDFIFTKAAKSNLCVGEGDSIEITSLPTGKIIETPEKHIVVLTISSYLFRLLTIFHINTDKVTEAYFKKSDAGADFFEVFSEVGNLTCGAMNRDIGNYFPHLGMSTPYILESKCIPFLKELKPNYVSQHKIIINDQVSMHATLCMCSYAPIDFKVDMSIAAEETGALELF
jgi:hypothetical protein